MPYPKTYDYFTKKKKKKKALSKSLSNYFINSNYQGTKKAFWK